MPFLYLYDFQDKFQIPKFELYFSAGVQPTELATISSKKRKKNTLKFNAKHSVYLPNIK
jgi:hypothetical protein